MIRGKEGQGSSQGACVEDPLTEMRVRIDCRRWGWVGQEGGMVGK